MNLPVTDTTGTTLKCPDKRGAHVLILYFRGCFVHISMYIVLGKTDSILIRGVLILEVFSREVLLYSSTS